MSGSDDEAKTGQFSHFQPEECLLDGFKKPTGPHILSVI
jgi:hypothetical protein